MSKTPHQIRQLLGLTGYFRKFIKNCASKTSLLTDLLKKDLKWNWTHTDLINHLKEVICSIPILAIISLKLETRVYIASQEEIGVIII